MNGNDNDNAKVVFTSNGDPSDRMVILKYYLDRNGMDVSHASARIWKNAPHVCTAADVYKELEHQGIVTSGDDILVEIYLDRYKAYISIDACHNNFAFDFEASTSQNPGVLCVRLTDVNLDPNVKVPILESKSIKHCSMGPLGLFVFMTNVGYPTASLTSELVEGAFVSKSYVLDWAPYAECVSGLLLLLCGMWEVTRNNIYGSIAFSAFGCFWLANGLQVFTTTFFPDQIDPELLNTPDPWGTFIKQLFILGFCLNLFYQTFALNKISSILIFFLSSNVFFGMIAPFAPFYRWFQMVFGWLTTATAFYSFTVNFINEVYHHRVFNIFPWTRVSPKEVFAAAGRTSLLHEKITKLRKAGKGTNHFELRAAAKSRG